VAVSGAAHNFPSNKDFVMSFIADKMIASFPNLNKSQVETFVIQLFSNCDDWKQFKSTMRDMMISMRSFSDQENSFYEHQKKLAKEKALKKES